jgi:lipopolysaccharide/colanic/teichoic acid biosynthesis glycosyltransferase
MRAGSDPYAPSPGGEADHRLTKVGRFLRERSIDELPQLWNVIEGTMSLVGPRPLYEKQAEKWTARQRRRLEVRPGLTGLAQVSGRGGLTHEEKLEIDVQYIEKRCLVLDLKIFAITFIRIFRRSDDIYETSRDQ